MLSFQYHLGPQQIPHACRSGLSSKFIFTEGSALLTGTHGITDKALPVWMPTLKDPLIGICDQHLHFRLIVVYLLMWISKHLNQTSNVRNVRRMLLRSSDAHASRILRLDIIGIGPPLPSDVLQYGGIMELPEYIRGVATQLDIRRQSN